ncbi:Kinesin-like protein [Melia azedarach]|uniref:Kinesin-like protein n=1 Tax=Melia azedarach TaxID=155640 RepID=A0ACC1X4M4_MELAZ|nr:Kinesin-like protein [Melia azedarach]
MENSARSVLHDFNLASRKAEEAASRRLQAARWLESLVGPLGISSQPSERDFISCLRNGLILCNAINKINPGAVPKVVDNSFCTQSFSREPQPPPAYQYFENVRNFLVAVEELKLPAFEASDLERDTLEAGSAAKIVDCILALKSYHEGKQINCGNGFYKHARSPMFMHSASRPARGSAVTNSDSCRHLDMSAICEKLLPVNGENQKLTDSIVDVLADYMIGAKENFDNNLLGSLRNGSLDSFKLLSKILTSFSEQLQNELPELKSMFEDYLKESSLQTCPSPPEDLSVLENFQHRRCCSRKGNCNHRQLLQMQEKELLDLKDLLSRTRREFKDLESQLQSDVKELGSLVQEMSTAALGYQRVVKENRKLYNMVQDLKGNIRVYCRIRPAFSAETKNVIEYIGEDGCLVISDPLKLQKDGRKNFQFNHVFGPAATQDDVFKETQPLIRSVMDGYNVCIFAYGQTGSGKTHTMSGSSRGSTKDMGINYLALEDLFQISNKRKDIINYVIHVQMVEIYNEQIRSCASENGLSLPDATMCSVKSTADVLDLMKLGEVNRVVSSTAINNRSSRSHSVLTVHVHGKDVSGSILRSCLHLVDLAGSERVDKSEVTGDRLKEAQYINKSLSCLGDVITALAQKNSHIPYRNSKLTLLLQDSLGGHAKTLMFAHVSPEGDSFGETVSTLKFAQRVSTVELGAARANKESNEVMKLKEQIESLKKALANKEAQKAIAMTDRTPPHTRRLSIENGSAVKTEKAINCQDKKGTKTPSVPTRARRLSLEGPKYSIKENIQVNVSDGVSKPLQLGSATRQKYGQFQDAEAVSKPYGHFSSYDSSVKAPKSPTNFSYQKRAVKADSKTVTSSLQLPKTPERQLFPRNEVQILMQSELTLSTEPRTTNGKGSQIRKSLRTIGKLINGSEKRNNQNLTEARSPTRFSSNINDGKSPLSTNARALRRQSLTGSSQNLGSRRSSLGGKPVEPTVNDNRNAKTPPPVHPSAKTTKRWL